MGEGARAALMSRPSRGPTVRERRGSVVSNPRELSESRILGLFCPNPLRDSLRSTLAPLASPASADGAEGVTRRGGAQLELMLILLECLPWIGGALESSDTE
jgi:hypothetical protein